MTQDTLYPLFVSQDMPEEDGEETPDTDMPEEGGEDEGSVF